MVEVSLYDLLQLQFDPTIDAQQAELELDRYRWNPLDTKALGVVPFRGHVSRLCTRAGKTGWALRGNVICNTFPEWLRKKVNVTKTEEGFWSSIEESVNTELMDRQRADDRRGQNDDRPTDKSDKSERRSRDSRSDKKCIFCWYNGHEVADCRKMKAARASLPPRQDQAPSDKGGSKDKDAAKDAGASTSDRRAPTCYNCHKTGHISTFCPEPKRDRKVSANVATSHDAPVYVRVPAPSAPAAVQLAYDERIDENEVIDVCRHQMDLPLISCSYTGTGEQGSFYL